MNVISPLPRNTEQPEQRTPVSSQNWPSRTRTHTEKELLEEEPKLNRIEAAKKKGVEVQMKSQRAHYHIFKPHKTTEEGAL